MWSFFGGVDHIPFEYVLVEHWSWSFHALPPSFLSTLEGVSQRESEHFGPLSQVVASKDEVIKPLPLGLSKPGRPELVKQGAQKEP